MSVSTQLLWESTANSRVNVCRSPICVDIPPEFDRSSIFWLVFYLLDHDGRVLTHETNLYTAINRQFSLKR